jgi:hypothetical protein
MKKLIAIALCFFVPFSTVAGDSGHNIRYDGGSLPDVKAGKGMKLYIDTAELRLETKDENIAKIPTAWITEISYGQDVHRRVGAAIGLAIVSLGIGALLALSKSKKHFIGVTWANGEQKGGFAMQCDKSDYRGILAGLEGVTGKKAVNSDPLTVKN